MLLYLQMLSSDEDREKFEELYSRYKYYMFSIANSILKNHEDSEDAVHQAFLALIKCVDKIGETGSSKTKALVSIVVRNKAIDICRLRERQLYSDINEIFVCNHSMIPEENELAEIITGLPQKMRDILLLHYDNGYSTYEISKMLNMKLNTVQKNITRAKKIIREKLSAKEVSEE